MDRPKIVEVKAKHENSEDAKDGNSIYRNCLVCGENNKKCGSFIIAKIKLNFSGQFSGKYTGTGLQVCRNCQVSKIISLKIEFIS
jgi:hypothetical protein